MRLLKPLSMLCLYGALLVFSHQVHAFTTSTCEETWYAPTPGQEFTGKRASWQKIKTQPCAKHQIRILSARQLPYDDYNEEGSGAAQSEIYAIVDGGGYFVRKIDVGQGPYCGRGDTAGFNMQCFLPRSLRHYEAHHYRNYYQITATPTLDLVAGCGTTYATDGQSVFYLTSDHRYEETNTPDTPFKIQGAHLGSFKCFEPRGETTGKDDAWASDENQVFFDGRLAKGMTPSAPVWLPASEFMNVDKLAVNGEQAFRVGGDGVQALFHLDGDLKILSPSFFRDRTSVFDAGFNKIEGVDPEKFFVIPAVCPVPGHPGLRCINPAKANVWGYKGNIGIQDGMLVIFGDAIMGSKKVLVNGLHAKGATLFFLGDAQAYLFLLFDGRLYRPGKVKDGAPIQGRLVSGAQFSNCVLDDAGGISFDGLRRVDASCAR